MPLDVVRNEKFVPIGGSDCGLEEDSAVCGVPLLEVLTIHIIDGGV
jgi:hypothetical protein